MANALDYAVSGCMESRLPNIETHHTGNSGVNYGSVIEMTLRDGRIKFWGDPSSASRPVIRAPGRATTSCGARSRHSSRTW